ncbi:ParB/RepB/Spo0J family partition protein [Streptomyces sp. 4.24]|uniref:ParB/RepB/Spo0J family partition protein n=1 Tax=Streptomyces tritrimontium TaxID=3406573 RepID=UPI003BB5849C
MSKKDLLGASASFSSARRPSERSERGRAKAMAQGEIPTYELIKIPLDQVSPTPLNPRRNFGSAEDLTRFGEELRESQLAACVAVNRSTYLALWPGHESQIQSAAFILINGERRFRSALHVGLDTLDFVVRDDLAKSREDFIDHLLAENLEREDFDVIERARGVAQLVAICEEEKSFGAKSRAAERLRKSPGWVTQQLALLDLPVQIQTLLSLGELPERDGRVLVRELKNNPSLGPDELLAILKQAKGQEARAKDELQAVLRAVLQDSSEVPAVQEASAAVAGSPTEPFTAVKSRATPQDVSEAPSSVPLPALPDDTAVSPAASQSRDQLVLDRKPVTETSSPQKVEPVVPAQSRPSELSHLPWQEPQKILDAICANMTPKDRAELTMLLIERQTPKSR